MAIISNMLAVNQPSGFWVNIIKAFENVTNNYILAIIFLTVVLRLVWSVVDLLRQYSGQKTQAVQAKMAPELEKVRTKYASQPQLLKQKENEVQRKYMGKGMFGSCFISLLVMGLNLLIFITLFSGLNSMASYKIVSSYDQIKYTYANCLNVTSEYFGENLNDTAKLEKFADYENLSFVIGVDSANNETKTISLVYKAGEANQEILAITNYKKDFSETIPAPEVPAEPAPQEEQGGETGGEIVEPQPTIITSNENIVKLIDKFFPVYEEGDEPFSKEIIVKSEIINGENGPETKYLYLSNALQNVAMENIVVVYEDTKEGFLWVENIWIADSPMDNSIISFNSLVGQMGGKKKVDVQTEERIYNAFMPTLKDEKGKSNGFFIIPFLCIGASFLSVFMTGFYNKRKNKKKGLPPPQKANKWMTIVLPLVFGIFAFIYNTVFATYLLVSQLVTALLTPLQLLIVDKIIDKQNSKKEEETKVTVDYSRKF